MNIKLHTGCNCFHCRKGRNKRVRKFYTRKMRKLYKRQLKRYGDIIDAVISIGYTD